MARVLLIEDDASIQRFVTFALEEMPLELLITGSVQEALSQLRQGAVDLILTDLMLPGESGIDLLEHLKSHPELAGQARAVVFSAGLTPTVKTQLQALGVWRMLSKPISVMDLIGCVEEGIGINASADGQNTPQDLGQAHEPGLNPAERQAVQEHFNGDTAFFLMYRDTCWLQFVKDIATGDQAASAMDWMALRRLGHSLKTVLQTLGEATASQQGKALEQAAEQADSHSALLHWTELKASLQSISGPRGPR
ncbi:response regulator [Curvibacter sp. HBC28]|jgi:CheY-like chemotaxis protein|uniref:Response regulator n=1 Tax=Curvibacter microcysteis TaxID=3026419 RepID=A0ABT5MD23_9BURK|nr:hybrid sensor histidine kinase/response regulator [Curvibacter sp. HBC28]MDD0814477.1 response regulator [Curvibacter sp. HBC28]